MNRLILHEHPDQAGDCLASLVAYAQRIPLRFQSIDEAATYIRGQPFRPDYGPTTHQSNGSAKDINSDWGDRRCEPQQRQRIWPPDFNCWEATAHWLAHALKLLHSGEVVDIWDRNITPTTRHVWPTLKRDDGIWLISLEGPRQKTAGLRVSANFGWEDVFGALHVAGASTLGFFLGADRSAPIVQQAEKLWGGNIAEWAKTGQEAAKAGESLVKYARYLNNVSSARPAETSGKPASTAGMAYEDI